MIASNVRLLLASATLATLAGFAACAGPDGTTPTCTNDVSAKGIDPTVTDGCNPFPPCDKGDPSLCCAGLMGTDKDDCLYAYGVKTLTSATTGSGGSGGGAATGSGGSGGSGGGK